MRLIDCIDTEFVSHEFKTPLSVLLTQFELMDYYLDDKAKLRGLVSVASQNSCRITRLIGNLLDIIRIDAGHIRVDLTDTDVCSLIKEVCNSASPYAKAKSIKLVCETPQCVKIMPVDIEKTERIVLNLLSNAIKYTEECREIIVRIQDNKENGIIFSVEDTGSGISEDKLHSIFGRSEGADSPIAGKTDGCGIGLVLVKSYVEMLGGKITAASKIGEGSKFSVELPILEAFSDTHINVYGLNLAKKAEIELSDLDLKR
jgi:signal transduction histidine kinase